MTIVSRLFSEKTRRNFCRIFGGSSSRLAFVCDTWGCFGYTALAVQIFSPHIYKRFVGEFFSPLVNESLWFSSNLGIGFYLYRQPHLACLGSSSRVLFSAYTCIFFNFGSVLLWTLLARIVPRSRTTRSCFAIACSVLTLMLGRDYVDHINGGFVTQTLSVKDGQRLDLEESEA